MIAKGINDLICVGVNQDIISAWQQVYENCKTQPDDIISSELRTMPVDDCCRAVFQYMVDHTNYRLDPYGVQYIKTPARLIRDGEGDCKSYTMFIACCLYCLHIPCIVRFVNFDGGSQFTHVYPVALDECGNEIVLDACELDGDKMPKYNYARPYVKKQDIEYV